MKTLAIKITLRASWCHSLKEKRMVVRSIVQKLKNKFNISVAEVENQDIHQSIVIGICAVGNDNKQLDSIMNNIMNFVDENSEAEVINVEYDSYIF